MTFPDLLTSREIAERLRVSQRFFVERLCKSPKFPQPVPWCKKPLTWKAEDILEWMERQ